MTLIFKLDVDIQDTYQQTVHEHSNSMHSELNTNKYTNSFHSCDSDLDPMNSHVIQVSST